MSPGDQDSAMTDGSLSLRRADSRDLDRVEALLEEQGLPSEDVRTAPGSFFVASDGSSTEIVGIGGVEIHGSNGLLRSVVVTEPNRGKGYGRALCDALEKCAESEGVTTLYLLTTTATEFFEERGYREIPREDAPPSIRGTTEFADLCPSSANCLKKEV